MKKIFVFSLIISLIMFAAESVSAADSVRVPLNVEIIAGGTAVIIPEVNCPVPENSKLILENGEISTFYINFTEEGTYSYSVMQMPDERHVEYDTTVYKINVFVNEDDGELSYSMVVYRNEKKYSSTPFAEGFERLIFTNKNASSGGDNSPTENSSTDRNNPPPETNSSDETKSQKETNSPTKKISPTEKQTEHQGPNTVTQPQTGDDTMMEFYFLLAILASAGLFILSIVYTVNANKYIKEKKEERNKS